MSALEETIKAHALKEAPREACGLVVKIGLEPLSAVPCHNVAPFPETSFIVKPSDYLEHLEKGSLAGYYHSHPTGPNSFSQADIGMSEHSNYPIHLYSVPDDSFSVYTPNGATIPLLGRSFVFNVHDCVSLVDDYYAQKLGISFDHLERKLSDVTQGIENLFDWIKQRDLVIVQTLKEHDIILMNFGRVSKVNHAGVYVGDNHMLHQLSKQPSAITVYGGYWEKVTMFRLRHRTMV